MMNTFHQRFTLGLSVALLGSVGMFSLSFAQDATAEASTETTPAPTIGVTPERTFEATQSTLPEATEIAADDIDDLAPGSVIAQHEGLFPEGVEYDAASGFFLTSSVEGTIYRVDENGLTTPFIRDPRIPTSLGLEVDEERGRLLVAATDLQMMAYLGIYDLATGQPQQFIDLTVATPNDQEHFANDIAVDGNGNAYVTDSAAGVIYRVDVQGNASVFLEDETFSTQFALNGLDYQANGNYLLAVRIPNLIKIPLDNPAGFTTVEVGRPLQGADGLTFLPDGTAALVLNETGEVLHIASDDQFATARVVTSVNVGADVRPTTVAIRDGVPYVVHSHLNMQESSLAAFPLERVDFGS